MIFPLKFVLFYHSAYPPRLFCLMFSSPALLLYVFCILFPPLPTLLLLSPLCFLHYAFLPYVFRDCMLSPAVWHVSLIYRKCPMRCWVTIVAVYRLSRHKLVPSIIHHLLMCHNAHYRELNEFFAILLMVVSFQQELSSVVILLGWHYPIKPTLRWEITGLLESKYRLMLYVTSHRDSNWKRISADLGRCRDVAFDLDPLSRARYLWWLVSPIWDGSICHLGVYIGRLVPEASRKQSSSSSWLRLADGQSQCCTAGYRPVPYHHTAR